MRKAWSGSNDFTISSVALVKGKRMPRRVVHPHLAGEEGDTCCGEGR